MSGISFELETANSGGFSFIERLIIGLGETYFGLEGGPSEKGLVVGEIETLIANIEAQQQFGDFLDLLATKGCQELFSLFNEACWGSGRWEYGPPSAPKNPFIFLALPAATELFDSERAFLLTTTRDCSRIVFMNSQTGHIEEAEVSRSEYVSTWRSILKRIALS